MTEEARELLLKAQREYPVGTKFISPNDGVSPREVIKEDHNIYDNGTSVIIDGKFYVCYHGKWGVITHKGIPKQLPIFN
jgi:hypothetical protein